MSGGLFVKLDVGFFDNPKIVEVGEKAAWLYLNMLTYCKQHGSDGVITDAQLARLPVSRRANRVTSLSEARLIERSSTDDGWSIVGWFERNKSAAEIEDIRRIRRSAGLKGGRPRKNDKANGKQTESNLLSREKPRVQSTEVEVEVEKPPPPAPEQGDDGNEARAVVVADHLISLIGIVDNVAGADERAYAARALNRGWTETELEDAAREIYAMPPDDVERTHRHVLRGALKRMANSDPARTAPQRHQPKPGSYYESTADQLARVMANRQAGQEATP